MTLIHRNRHWHLAQSKSWRTWPAFLRHCLRS